MSDIWKAIPHRLIQAVDRLVDWSQGQWAFVSDLVTDGRLSNAGWFNRDGTAEYYDADGTLQTAAADVPRIAYDPDTGSLLGLAMEQAGGHAAETATITPIDDWWNGKAFTVVIRGVAAAYKGDFDYEYFYAAHDGSADNIVAIRRQTYNGDVYVLMVRDGIQTFAYNLGHVEPGAEFIALLTGGPEGTAAYVDDNPVYKGDWDSGKSLPLVDTIDIGHFQGGSQSNGYIRSLSMYPVSHVSALPGRPVEPPPEATGGGTVLTPDDGALVAMEDMPVGVRPVLGLYAQTSVNWTHEPPIAVGVAPFGGLYVQTSLNWGEHQTVGVQPISGTYERVPVTLSPNAGIISHGSLSMVNDGDTNTNNYLGVGPSTDGQPCYVELYLGSVQSLSSITVWHYYSDGRTYHSTKTEVSADGVNWTTVFDSAVDGEYAETSAGRTTSFATRDVLYIRDYLNGSYASTSNHWVEIETA
ncbi:MAG TPA: hypothetical protein VFL54_09915 [Gammaproteobacteria bacterium]|nr:hypothetical protein [Gammaproteobacteria bacterium]